MLPGFEPTEIGMLDQRSTLKLIFYDLDSLKEISSSFSMTVAHKSDYKLPSSLTYLLIRLNFKFDSAIISTKSFENKNKVNILYYT